ncbi:MAG: MFS transporter, partial [Acidobacteria bacterium]|nr:MFS transporter [Acidobacteriota bacterium]
MAQPAVSVAPVSAQPDRMTAAGWRIVLLASLGGTLEFYDFVIFGVFAKDIADAIFPSTSPIVSL